MASLNVYYIFLILVYFLLNNYCVCVDRLILRKCCPSDMFIDKNLSCGSLYNIIGNSTENNQSSRYDYTIPLYPFGENIDLVQGFINTSMDSDYCVDKMVELHDNDIIESKMYTQFIKLEDEKVANDQVIHIPKCCPHGYAYDSKLHYCTNNFTPTQDEHYFIKQLYDVSQPKFLNFHIRLRGCNKAVVDMSESDYNFYLIDEELHVVSKTDGIKEVYLNRSYCLDQNLDGALISRVCRDVSITCNSDTFVCVHKCCNEGQTFVKRKTSVKPRCNDDYYFMSYNPKFIHIEQNHSITVDNGFSQFAIVPNYKCPSGRYMIADNKADLLSTNGKLYIYENNKIVEDYCVDNVNIPKKKGLKKFRCFPNLISNNPEREARKAQRLIVYAFGLLISCAFLLATFIVYLFLPELQNLHGKTLMCHVFSLFIAQLILAMAQLKIIPLTTCVFIGFFIIFMFLAAFSWLNIMCFDIWWTFGGTRSVGGSTRRRILERKRFIYYSIYAWSVPAIITGMCVIADHTTILPEDFRPNIGFHTCFFDFLKYGVILFFIIPLICQSVCNLILFVLTAIHCSRVKAEIHRMQLDSKGQSRKKRFLNDRARLVMNVKLFIVMGVSWVWEASNIRAEVWFMYVGDAFNMLMGIPIFFIFVVKPKVWNLLCMRLGIKPPQTRPRSVSTATTSCTNPLRVKNSISSNSSILLSTPISASPAGK